MPNNTINAIAQQYAIGVISGVMNDTSNRSFPEKVGRAALMAIPSTLTINTNPLVEYIGYKLPNLGIENTGRYKNEVAMSEGAVKAANENNKTIVAYYDPRIKR